MIRWLIAGSFLALSACSDSVTDTDSLDQNLAIPGWRVDPEGGLNAFFDCLDETGAAIVAAHRGGPYPGFPENALETMAAVLTQTPALMEIDVATSSDGVLYLMHDDTLERTTTGGGAADGMSWSDLQTLRLEDNSGRETQFAPTRFDDALRWAEGRTILEIDFKRSTKYEAVADEIKRQGAEDRVILIAYSMASARKLHSLLPAAMISLKLDTQSELNRAVASGIPDDRILGFTGTEDPRPRLFSMLASRDVEVIFGTLGGRDSIDNDIERSGYEQLYADIAAQGVDIIATDRPREAHAALVEAGRAVEDGECGVFYEKQAS
ncbi:glycerophosphodiester phosphodiesterase family protein [Hyphococcus flavus]|uniref:Glycerophosphodiester phosphodiesterase family protein n=1 Tax=Hyphococcus flavus TaxID=1866326 RepID=A0AAF0CC72_9PROT|nr:glycerophosphodiester phosphodiesterase family protein [Hyphococcus flavus]WDI32770.1 glycerophosphodiester phosphodiesterase family protein [Hyphococcus flavus]